MRVMPDWSHFEQSVPDLAAFGRERLDSRAAYLATLRADSGPSQPQNRCSAGVSSTVWRWLHYNLRPPILKALGLKKKIKLDKWFDCVYRLLVPMRRRRGTRWDILGCDPIHKTQRALIQQYRKLLSTAVSELTAENHGLVVKRASLLDMIRGYDAVKPASVDKFWQDVQALGYADLRKR